MGFLDQVMAKGSQYRGKAEKAIADNSDKIGSGLDRAADAARKATNGRYDDKIAKATDKAKEGVDRIERGQGGGTGGSGGPGSDSGPSTNQ